jgi:tRNA nucleotidyltransferase/poly(A) polymerase
MNNIQCYICGGAIRDILLCLEPKDIDYVWTGITPDFLLEKGYAPVGADFPVFLDQNGDQHALARKERKVAVGYNGFVCEFDTSVTIEDDLLRRDLTCNSMAVKIEDWETFKITKCKELLIDPYNGLDDINNGILRATSNAFCEDPIRVLRTARFVARYDFQVDPDTITLMQNIVHELEFVPTERIWAEISKGLMEKYPLKMFQILSLCCAFEHPILKPFRNYHINALSSDITDLPLNCRFVLCSYNFHNGDYEKLSIPINCSSLAESYHHNKEFIYRYDHLCSRNKLDLLICTRSFNNTEQLESLFKIMSVYDLAKKPFIPELIRKDIQLLKQLDLTELTKGMKNGKDIQQLIEEKRLSVLDTNMT